MRVVQRWSTAPDDDRPKNKESEESNMTKQQSKWNADAEMSLMGFTIPVTSDEHLKHLIGYVLHTLYSDDSRTEEIFDNAVNKYRSDKDKSIKYFTVNSGMMGVMLTFVRDNAKLTLKNGKMTQSGNLAWVENLDCPDCSELGYVYFQRDNGKVHRVA